MSAGDGGADDGSADDDDGGPTDVSGFSATAPFSVTGAAGHDQPIVITRATGTFASRAFGSGTQHPWLFDTVSTQYRDGTNLNAYASLTDNQAIPSTVWQKVTYYGAKTAQYRTERSTRSPLYSALYSNAGETPEKMGIGNCTWPAAWGAHANDRLYVSWWAKDSTGWDDGKIFRLEDAAQQGLDFVGVDTLCSQTYIAGYEGAAVAGFPNGGGSMAGSTDWVRVELYYDKVAHTAGMWINGTWVKATFSSAGGDFEFRPADKKLYTSNNRDDNRWNPAALTSPGMWPAIIGMDEAGTSNPTQIVDLQEIYVDTELQRFEISDAPVWNTGPTGTATREICGRWSRNSNSEVTVYPNQGGFSTLVGKYLWYVTSETEAELVGRFE